MDIPISWTDLSMNWEEVHLAPFDPYAVAISEAIKERAIKVGKEGEISSMLITPSPLYSTNEYAVAIQDAITLLIPEYINPAVDEFWTEETILLYIGDAERIVSNLFFTAAWLSQQYDLLNVLIYEPIYRPDVTLDKSSAYYEYSRYRYEDNIVLTNWRYAGNTYKIYASWYNSSATMYFGGKQQYRTDFVWTNTTPPNSKGDDHDIRVKLTGTVRNQAEGLRLKEVFSNGWVDDITSDPVVVNYVITNVVMIADEEANYSTILDMTEEVPMEDTSQKRADIINLAYVLAYADNKTLDGYDCSDGFNFKLL